MKPLTVTPSRSPGHANGVVHELAAHDAAEALQHAVGECRRWPDRRRLVRSPMVSEKPTSGCAMARRFTVSETARFSERSDFRNLRRAGVAENSSRTSTRVPGIEAGRLQGALGAAVDGDLEARRARRACAIG